MTWIVILAVLNIPVYLFLGWRLFDNRENFIEALRYWIQPDMWSWFNGEGFEDVWAEAKLGVFFFLCGGAVFLEWQLLAPILTG